VICDLNIVLGRLNAGNMTNFKFLSANKQY